MDVLKLLISGCFLSFSVKNKMDPPLKESNQIFNKFDNHQTKKKETKTGRDIKQKERKKDKNIKET